MSLEEKLYEREMIKLRKMSELRSASGWLDEADLPNNMKSQKSNGTPQFVGVGLLPRQLEISINTFPSVTMWTSLIQNTVVESFT